MTCSRYTKGCNCAYCDNYRAYHRNRYRMQRGIPLEDPTMSKADAARIAAASRRTFGMANCVKCGAKFVKKQSTQKYCTQACRGRRERSGVKAPTDARGYGYEHAKARREWKKKITLAGGAACCLCGKWLRPEEPWHLDHTPDRVGYRGIACPTCNTSDGAKRGNRMRAHTQAARPWMQRDYHDCPVCGAVVTWASQRCCSRECSSTYRSRSKPIKPTTATQVVLFSTCEGCGVSYEGGSRYCSPRCAARTAYRRKVGIPDRAEMQKRGPKPKAMVL